MKNVVLSIVILLLLIAGCIVEYWNDKKNNETLLSTFDAAWLIATTAAILLALAIIVPKAYGHDHAKPELQDWYHSLTNKNSGPCCDGSEIDNGSAKRLSDEDWDVKDGHYRVHLDDQWVDVPDWAVVTQPNKDGRTLVWIFNGIIICFLPGAGT